MSHKIQITIDDQMNDLIRAKAKQMGLSVSSYARLILVNILRGKSDKMIEQAIQEVQAGKTETLTLDKFNHQIDDL